MATTNMRIVIRRDESSAWVTNGKVVLLRGEMGYETDTGKMKIGNSQDAYEDLPYFVGGITDVDGVTLVKDGEGTIALNTDSIVGNIVGTIKEYVDTGDSVLGAAISAEETARIAGDVLVCVFVLVAVLVLV